ncbi:UNVERIFIED_CONTAM: hypothetical protein NCL1_25533 [Trichonephila clavipes]
MLTKNLNTHTVYQHIVLHMLNEEQNTILMRLVGGSITAADKEPSLHCIIVTGDDKWCYFVRLTLSKTALATWKSPRSPRKQKFCHDRSKGKVMLKVFFNIQGIVLLKFISE